MNTYTIKATKGDYTNSVENVESILEAKTMCKILHEQGWTFQVFQLVECKNDWVEQFEEATA